MSTILNRNKLGNVNNLWPWLRNGYGRRITIFFFFQKKTYPPYSFGREHNTIELINKKKMFLGER